MKRQAPDWTGPRRRRHRRGGTMAVVLAVLAVLASAPSPAAAQNQSTDSPTEVRFPSPAPSTGTLGFCAVPNGPSACYNIEVPISFRVPIPGCSCHASCATCVRFRGSNDCITCPDGSTLTAVYDNGTGFCTAKTGPSECYGVWGAKIDGCMCDASCATCGYGDSTAPFAYASSSNDCITCPDGSTPIPGWLLYFPADPTPTFSPTTSPSYSPTFSPTESLAPTKSLAPTGIRTSIFTKYTQRLELEMSGEFDKIQEGIYGVIMKSYTKDFGHMVGEPWITTTCNVSRQQEVGYDGKGLLIWFEIEYTSSDEYNLYNYRSLFEDYINSNLQNVTEDMRLWFLPVIQAKAIRDAPRGAPTMGRPIGTLIKQSYTQRLKIETPKEFNEIRKGIYGLIMQSYTKDFGHMVGEPNITTTCDVTGQEVVEPDGRGLRIDFTIRYSSRYGYDLDNYPSLFGNYTNSNLQNVTSDMREWLNLPDIQAREVEVFAAAASLHVPLDEPEKIQPTFPPMDVTDAPTNQPVTDAPTNQPVTDAPTNQPVTDALTNQPVTDAPTNQPVTDAPTNQPVTDALMNQPTTAPMKNIMGLVFGLLGGALIVALLICYMRRRRQTNLAREAQKGAARPSKYNDGGDDYGDHGRPQDSSTAGSPHHSSSSPEPSTLSLHYPNAAQEEDGGVQGSPAAVAFDFVFSNKTKSDALCLEVRNKLTSHGVKVWQQRTNIPKDSVNWFDEWFPSAVRARKIVCFLTAEYLKSPYCMREFGIALNSDRLLVVACEPRDKITAVEPSDYPYASNALAYLISGGQVIFNDSDDVIAEILKFAAGSNDEEAGDPDLRPVDKAHLMNGGQVIFHVSKEMVAKNLRGSNLTDVFDFVFSNKTKSDALCLEVRDKLMSHGVSVWQQRTNIPKDSDNWFDEWFLSARKARKIVCFLTVDYIKSPYCMKEFRIALNTNKLLVVACDPLPKIKEVDPSTYPKASEALGYLINGGEVIIHDSDCDDVVAEILKLATNPGDANPNDADAEAQPKSHPVEDLTGG